MILPVINIGTGVSNRPNVVIKIGLLGYGGLLRLSQDRMPIVFYDRPAILAEAMTFFFFFFYLSAQHPQSDRVYPRSTIIEYKLLKQGMHLNVFSKVNCASPIRQGISEEYNIETGYAFECF